jgi:ABC-type phosphate/phosphonate transport system substrate-binding protein
MQVRSMNQMQQMNQMQNTTQTQRAQGKGPHGMGAIMRNLSPDQREEISKTLQSMDESQRQSVVKQIKELDTQNLSSDELYQNIMDILNPQTQTNVVSTTTVNTYA